MKQKILSQITTECPWRDTLYWYDTIDSTNTHAKILAKEGAPHGTVVIAGSQTGGRGRMGRSFSSPAGMGVYLSVILRPGCPPNQLMHLTCAAGIAGRNAIKKICGISPDIKWANDLVFGRKKLGGILTELGFTGSMVDYAVIGIGINCCQKNKDFPKELQSIATSVEEYSGAACAPDRLAAALIEELYQMDKQLLRCKAQMMEDYRRCCITIGKDISVLQADTITHGTALDVNDDGALIVQFPDGSTKAVNFGEVSVRGMYGYL